MPDVVPPAAVRRGHTKPGKGMEAFVPTDQSVEYVITDAQRRAVVRRIATKYKDDPELFLQTVDMLGLNPEQGR